MVSVGSSYELGPDALLHKPIPKIQSPLNIQELLFSHGVEPVRTQASDPGERGHGCVLAVMISTFSSMMVSTSALRYFIWVLPHKYYALQSTSYNLLS